MHTVTGLPSQLIYSSVHAHTAHNRSNVMVNYSALKCMHDSVKRSILLVYRLQSRYGTAETNTDAGAVYRPVYLDQSVYRQTRLHRSTRFISIQLVQFGS